MSKALASVLHSFASSQQQAYPAGLSELIESVRVKLDSKFDDHAEFWIDVVSVMFSDGRYIPNVISRRDVTNLLFKLAHLESKRLADAASIVYVKKYTFTRALGESDVRRKTGLL